ncbi:CHAT domain-containing protein [Actinocorallia populi]|uniref:CHAT domain-containing protein n=1 Tax=Actinocorallia populi TaxID=2079200 RepID=UPI000D0895BF|nr:CHAT domain-containing protein [Actinocorallia populi]
MIDTLLADALAAKESGELARGLAVLERALRLSRDDARGAARVRATMIPLLTAQGRTAQALHMAELAEPHLDGADLERLRINLSYARASRGRLEKPAPPRRGDPAARTGRLIANGLTHAYAGRFEAAGSALHAAAALAARCGPRVLELMVANNQAFLAARRGDLPWALGLFAEIEPELGGERLTQCRLDRAEALLAAGFAGDARELLAEAAVAAAAMGFAADAANAVYLRSLAELACGDARAAAESAVLARIDFAAQDRPGWVVKAEHALVRARAAGGDRSPALLASARRTAEELELLGWPEPAARTLLAAALAFPREAPELLPRPSARTPASLRLALDLAAAQVHAARGENAPALRAVRAALETADRLTRGYLSLELRARTDRTCRELMALAVELTRTPRELLAFEELRRRILRPPSPARPPRTGAEDERERRELARTAALTAPRPHVTMPDLLSALDEAVLVELVRAGDGLHAVVARDGRCRRLDLGSYTEAVKEARILRFSLTRAMLDGGTPGPPPARFADALALAAGRELVLAPTGALYGMPWAALTGVPFTVVPSATAWLAAQRREAVRGHVALLHGPGLDHAREELAALAPRYPGARTGTSARLLAGARLAHLAAHGTFREDDPLLSAILLQDGPLTGYDLAELGPPPELVVLSACDAGQGHDLLGLPGVLLSLGVRTVIASVTPLPDASSPALMRELHRLLAEGLAPAAALAALPRDAAALGLQCFGAG